jgi:tRNA threonylcarbamoyladenosine biosynthesis protein TsaE
MATHTFKFISKSLKDTERFGKTLGRLIKSADIICLFGDLGAGKTTLTKYVASSLRINQDDVSSPTFVLMNIYDGKIPIYHFDLYRLDNEDQIVELGYEEFFYGDGLSIVEWADKLGTLLPKEYLEIKLEHKNENERSIKCCAHGLRYKNILNSVKEKL